jgi:hypothetical protein
VRVPEGEVVRVREASPPALTSKFERRDPILGIVRLCSGCEEEWPVDDEFYRPLDDTLCRACRDLA